MIVTKIEAIPSEKPLSVRYGTMKLLKLQEEAQKRPSKNMALMVTLQTESCVMMALPSG